MVQPFFCIPFSIILGTLRYNACNLAGKRCKMWASVFDRDYTALAVKKTFPRATDTCESQECTGIVGKTCLHTYPERRYQAEPCHYHSSHRIFQIGIVVKEGEILMGGRLLVLELEPQSNLVRRGRESVRARSCLERSRT